MVFVFAILVLSKSKAHTKFLGMGAALAAVHMLGIPFTGASVNPARSFAPALVGDAWSGFWVYVVGPVVGAVLAWVLYKLIVEGDTDFSDDLSDIKDNTLTYGARSRWKGGASAPPSFASGNRSSRSSCVESPRPSKGDSHAASEDPWCLLIGGSVAGGDRLRRPRRARRNRSGRRPRPQALRRPRHRRTTTPVGCLLDRGLAVRRGAVGAHRPRASRLPRTARRHR